jgi:hypothetical protein
VDHGVQNRVNRAFAGDTQREFLQGVEVHGVT